MLILIICYKVQQLRIICIVKISIRPFTYMDFAVNIPKTAGKNINE
jgi:hypothetical protein